MLHGICDKVNFWDQSTSAKQNDIHTVQAALADLSNLDIAVVYLNHVDAAGHDYGFGPQVPEYMAALERTDALVAPLIRSAHAQGLAIAVTTDHGGTARESMPTAMLDNFFDQSWCKPQGCYAGLHGMPDEGGNALIPHWLTFQCYHNPQRPKAKEILPSPTNADVAKWILNLATGGGGFTESVDANDPEMYSIKRFSSTDYDQARALMRHSSTDFDPVQSHDPNSPTALAYGNRNFGHVCESVDTVDILHFSLTVSNLAVFLFLVLYGCNSEFSSGKSGSVNQVMFFIITFQACREFLRNRKLMWETCRAPSGTAV